MTSIWDRGNQSRRSWLHLPRGPFLEPDDVAVIRLRYWTGERVPAFDDERHRARVFPATDFGMAIGKRKTAGPTMVIGRKILIPLREAR